MAMLNCLRGAWLPIILLDLGTRADRISPEIIEAALAHKQADRVVAAYARTSYLDRRRELMEEWGRFCVGG